MTAASTIPLAPMAAGTMMSVLVPTTPVPDTFDLWSWGQTQVLADLRLILLRLGAVLDVPLVPGRSLGLEVGDQPLLQSVVAGLLAVVAQQVRLPAPPGEPREGVVLVQEHSVCHQFLQ